MIIVVFIRLLYDIGGMWLLMVSKVTEVTTYFTSVQFENYRKRK